MDNHTQDESLKEHLLATNEAFRSLAQKHAEYCRQIEAIESKSRVTQADELEEQRLKKLKLNVKDQMNELLAQYKHSSVG